MEKTMSIEEKIRRAEEIYNRRNAGIYYRTYDSNMSEKKSKSLKRRLIKQMIICLIIYGIFYVVDNRNYFMSQDFKQKVESVASKNEKLNNTYNYFKGYLDKYFYKNENIEKQNNESNGKEQIEKQDIQNLENITSESSSTEEIDKEENMPINEENIGGAEEVEESTAIKTQEELDVEDIKNKISFIIPVQGYISSTFGWRNPTTASVPKYHTGLDIATSQGTVIKSATDGTITMASNEGDYGKHYRIQIEDVTIIYAHCSKLYLKEGDTVKQGQEIAEVGSTRKFNTDRIFILKLEKRID